jgi:CheY-like chemotaxis protein
MTAARIIESIGSLLWPLLVAVLVWRLVPLLPGLVADLRQALRTRAFSVRVGAVELSVEEATELLRRQVADLQRQVESQVAAPAVPAAPPTPGSRPPATAGAAATDRAAPQAPWSGRPLVLWVDDRPDGNAFEMARLRDDGVELLQARSTDEALDVLALRRGVQALITDLGRTEGGEYRPHAGLALLRRLREDGLELPVLVYTGRRGVERERAAALAAGAAVVTASPVELFASLRSVLMSGGAAAASPGQGDAFGNHRPRRPRRLPEPAERPPAQPGEDAG